MTAIELLVYRRWLVYAFGNWTLNQGEPLPVGRAVRKYRIGRCALSRSSRKLFSVSSDWLTIAGSARGSVPGGTNSVGAPASVAALRSCAAREPRATRNDHRRRTLEHRFASAAQSVRLRLERALHARDIQIAACRGRKSHFARKRQRREMQQVDVLDEQADQLGLQLAGERGERLERGVSPQPRVEANDDSAHFHFGGFRARQSLRGAATAKARARSA
jgi:hypothetical protein